MVPLGRHMSTRLRSYPKDSVLERLWERMIPGAKDLSVRRVAAEVSEVVNGQAARRLELLQGLSPRYTRGPVQASRIDERLGVAGLNNGVDWTKIEDAGIQANRPLLALSPG